MSSDFGVPAPAAAAAALFAGTGPSLEALRTVDWAASPLGPVAGWPADLAATVRTILPARVPLALWWDSKLVQIPNPACLALLDPAGPIAAVAASECWPEHWARLEPLVERARHGAAAFDAELTVPAAPDGADDADDAAWMPGASPVRDAVGEVAGVLVTFTDVSSGGAALAALAAQNEQLSTALGTNRRIGAAIGILMCHRRIGEEAAFDLLSKASQDANRKMREIADEVLLTGDLPVGRPRSR